MASQPMQHLTLNQPPQGSPGTSLFLPKPGIAAGGHELSPMGTRRILPLTATLDHPELFHPSNRIDLEKSETDLHSHSQL